MNKLLPAAALLLTMAAGPALAGNNGQSQTEQIGELNVAHLTITGSGNSVSLYQDMPADALDGNWAKVSIVGDGNGAGSGTGGSLFTGLGIGQPLVPGRISQVGTGNRLSLRVVGNGNLFAFSQSGGPNTLTGTIDGSGNQVAALQVGAGNVMSFSQVGSGNMLSVTQIAR
jgi:hypothetical protein